MSSHHIVSTLLYLLEDAASYLLCVLEVLEVLGLLTFPGVLGLLEVLGSFAYFRMESVR